MPDKDWLDKQMRELERDYLQLKHEASSLRKN